MLILNVVYRLYSLITTSDVQICSQIIYLNYVHQFVILNIKSYLGSPFLQSDEIIMFAISYISSLYH